MSSISRSVLPNDHRDYSRLLPIASFLEQPNHFGERLTHEYPFLVDDTICQSIDATRTGRTRFEQLYTEEKKNLGSLIEVRIRDLLGVDRSTRDLRILNEDVDVKNTIGASWMIPRETYQIDDAKDPGILLLCQYSPTERKCNLGLLVAHIDYLTRGQNRDQKVSVSAAGMKNIWWLVFDVELPPDKWKDIDIAKYRKLRQSQGGSRRAAEFFSAHMNIPIERGIIQSLLFDQRDYMKRLRRNGGARDLLGAQGITIRSERREFASVDGGVRYYDYWVAEQSTTPR